MTTAPPSTPTPPERTESHAAPSRILRWPVPVDDHPHEIGCGNVVMVATRSKGPYDGQRHVVEVWTEEHPGPDWPERQVRTRMAQVYGTGHTVPGRHRHLGSCLDALTDGQLVWHVFEVRER